jgi:hypothetical protein
MTGRVVVEEYANYIHPASDGGFIIVVDTFHSNYFRVIEIDNLGNDDIFKFDFTNRIVTLGSFYGGNETQWCFTLLLKLFYFAAGGYVNAWFEQNVSTIGDRNISIGKKIVNFCIH